MSKIGDVVSEIAKQQAEKLGLEIWDIEIATESSKRVLRLYADKSGGIGIDDCEALSHAVIPLLDEAIEESYMLEVSSPGMERALKRPEHYARYIGENVEIRLYAPQDGRKSVCGVLLRHTPSGVAIGTGEGELEFKHEQIARTKLKPDYSKYF